MRVVLYALLWFCCLECGHTQDYGFNESENSFHVQKCCPLNSIFNGNGCTESKDVINYTNIEVYKYNNTHYWTWEDVDMKYIYNDPCRPKTKWYNAVFKIRIETENETDRWFLLANKSIYIPDDLTMINSDEYCLEVYEGNIEAFMCYEKSFLKKYLQGVCKLISASILFILAYFKHVEKMYRYDSKKCLITLCIILGVHYLIMAVYKFTSYGCTLDYGSICKFIWIAQYYLTIAYHIWMALFCIELYRNINKNRDKVFGIRWICGFKSYFIISFVISAVFTLIFTLLLKEIPEKSLEKSHIPEQWYLLVVFYYIPTGLLCIFSFLFGIYMIRSFLSDKSSVSIPECVRIIKGHEKQFYKKCIVVFFLLTLIWLLNLILYLLSVAVLNTTTNPELLVLNVLIDLMGLIFFLLFFKKHWCFPSNIDNDFENAINDSYEQFILSRNPNNEITMNEQGKLVEETKLNGNE